MRGMSWRPLAMGSLAVALVVGWGLPAAAQSTGMVKGKVVDGDNKTVEGAEVVIESKEGGLRTFKVKTNRRGEYLQIGLTPGPWSVTATKEGIGTASADFRVSIGATEQVDLTLRKAGPSAEDQAKMAAMSTAFNEGVAASQAGKHDEAIAKFGEALKLNEDCYACHYNIGLAQLAKQDYAKAEASLLQASKLKPDAPEPYNQLASVYNQQRQFDKAAAMATEAAKRSGGAAGAASPETLFNQGVVLWNANKYAEAKAQFEAAIAAKPDYAEAYYWVGMANLNQGNMPDAVKAMESYLKHAPTGQYAEQAKSIVSQLKK